MNPFTEVRDSARISTRPVGDILPGGALQRVRARRAVALLLLAACALVGVAFALPPAPPPAQASTQPARPGLSAAVVFPGLRSAGSGAASGIRTAATTYAEIGIKPYGSMGVVSAMNLMVWGVDSHRSNGDAYSPAHLDDGTTNPWYADQPHGYLYRIVVPASYRLQHTRLDIQIFDPDSYNRPDFPPTPCPTTTPGPGTPVVTCTPTADMQANCVLGGICTTSGPRYNTGLRLGAYPVPSGTPRPAFWRVDEVRPPYNSSTDGYSSSRTTQTTYTLWHFNPYASSIFGDPRKLTDAVPAAPIATYTVREDLRTDLRWYTPPGFAVDLTQLGPEPTSNISLYLYVQGISGSSENNFDLRAGPPSTDIPTNLDCGALDNNPYASPCYVNAMYFNQVPDWSPDGVQIVAERSLPMNADTGASFPLIWSQVSRGAAGQTISMRHFDQDCNNGCGSQMDYQMQICNTDPTLDSSWEHVAYGYIGPNDGWYCSGCANPEKVGIPDVGTPLYNDFFVANGGCPTSALRVQVNPSYSQDTTVWELPWLPAGLRP